MKQMITCKVCLDYRECKTVHGYPICAGCTTRVYKIKKRYALDSFDDAIDMAREKKFTHTRPKSLDKHVEFPPVGLNRKVGEDG